MLDVPDSVQHHISVFLTPKITIMLNEEHSEELRALRNLERTVRAYGITTFVISAHKRREMLAAALREVIDARKRAIRKSRRIAEK